MGDKIDWREIEDADALFRFFSPKHGRFVVEVENAHPFFGLAEGDWIHARLDEPKKGEMILFSIEDSDNVFLGIVKQIKKTCLVLIDGIGNVITVRPKTVALVTIKAKKISPTRPKAERS